MRYLFIFLFLLGSNGFAKDLPTNPDLGTYSAFTEADWTVAFELKGEGKAMITTELSYDYDEKGKKFENKKTVNGSWEFKQPYLYLSYDGIKDRFIRAQGCYENKPCFKYDQSLEKKSSKSPLNVNYEFIKWEPSFRQPMP